MPRPRRTKVASSAPRVVSSPPAHQASTSEINNIDETMPPKKRGRGRPPKNKKALDEPAHTDEASVTVDEAPAPKANVRPRGRPALKKTLASGGHQSALDALKQRRDAALQAKNVKESIAAVAKPTATPAPKSSTFQRLQRTSSSKRSNERVASTPRSTPTSTQAPLSAQIERTPSSKKDTDEELYGLSPGGEASRLRLESRRGSIQYPQSALKAQGTPAVETSVLALANFKRRPRQGSIIRMVQQTSELGDPEDDPLLRGLEDTLDDLEDFNPENESTPLHLGKRKSDIGGDEPRTSSSRKRKHAEEDEEIQVPQSSPPIASSPPPRERGESSSPSSSPASLPEIILSTEREVDIYSDTMAPPQSSSAPPSPAKPPIRADKRRKTSGRNDQESEQDNENAPSPAQSRKQKSRKRAPAISTAALQSLLPKPRPKARAAKHLDTYDIPSSDPLSLDDTSLASQDDDNDDDELAQPKGRRGTKTPMRKVSGNREGTGKLRKSTKTNSPVSAKKAPPAKGKGKEPETVKVKKTYGRAAVEKENDHSINIPSDHPSDEDDDDTEIVAGGKKRAGSVALSKLSKTKELEQARQKFAEIDEWEMEFESVDLGGGSSSPWR